MVVKSLFVFNKIVADKPDLVKAEWQICNKVATGSAKKIRSFPRRIFEDGCGVFI
jgi:hypothetical protein